MPEIFGKTTASTDRNLEHNGMPAGPACFVHPVKRSGRHYLLVATFLLLLPLMLLFAASAAAAQQSRAVQEIIGRADSDAGDAFRMAGLREGQTLYLHAATLKGSLDPFLLVVEGDQDLAEIRDTYDAGIAAALEAGQDPILALPEILADLALAWDDDGGQGYDAALAFEVPADGDYWLLLVAAPVGDSFGRYRLLLGLDAPEVLEGDALPTGATIAVPDTTSSIFPPAVQQITGTLSAERNAIAHEVNEVEPGDTFFAYVEATSGDLAPVLILEDFGGKPLRSGNLSGELPNASLDFTAPQTLEGYTLRVRAHGDGATQTTGDYRLLVGRNAPEVLDGLAETTGEAVLRAATPVQVGLRLQQITDVDQQAENFGAVATIQMRWSDPALAFSADDCECDLQTFSASDFATYVRDSASLWPDFTVFNQQGRRFTQNDNVVVWPNGDVLYFERFSATLQAPDFDFRRFPFDTQNFYIRLDSLFPENFFLFEIMDGYSQLGDQLGEEEWKVQSFTTEISETTASSNQPVSRFSFGFVADRHLSFYIVRIFVPILIIITVSWITFFLRDYSKRVDVTAGNLLLFIAFNFTISGELPRLGYLTFLDTILISTFAVTALVVAFNVVLRRLELAGRADLAQRIDRYTLWIYPIAYIVAIGIVTILFT